MITVEVWADDSWMPWVAKRVRIGRKECERKGCIAFESWFENLALY